MVDRVAVLSDVHGVLPALTAVLTEPDVRTAERIVLTGDIAAGPQPVQTLDLLLSLGDHVELLDRLPKTVTLDVRGPGEVLFCHATPRDDEEFVLGGADNPAIQLRRTLFDRTSAADAIEADCDFPGIAEWTRFYVREPTSDTEALAAFTPRSRPADGALG